MDLLSFCFSKYSVPSPGTGTDIKYAESEDYFKAGPTYDKPDALPLHIWESLKTLIYTIVFMGIPTGFTWLTAGLAFGDVTGLLAKIKNSIGSKDAQMERINKAFRECTLLSKHHYFSWYGEFMELKNFSDSQAAINICRAPSYSRFTKH